MARSKTKKAAAKKAKKSVPSKKAAEKKPVVKAKAKAKAKIQTKAKVKTKTKAKPAGKSKTIVKAKAPTKPAAKPIPVHLVPLEDRVLVSIEGESDKTPGGLYIPATVSERPTRGRVLALGPGRRNKKGQVRPLDVQAGDVVLFNSYAGTPVTLQGTEYLILREEDVLGIET